MYYLTVAKGFRPGGSNSQPSMAATCVAALRAFGLSNGIPATYDSDSLWSYENGTKTRFADQRLQLDGSAFHIDWKNIQNAAQINGCGTAATFNLGKATSNGFDIVLDAALTKSLTFGTTVSYAKATYDKTIGAGTSTVVSKGDWVGGTGISAGAIPSPWTITAHGRYQFATYGGSDGYVWLEDVYRKANPGPVPEQNPNDTLSYDAALTQNPSTNVLNARLGVTIGKLDLSLFANNVMNSHPLLDRFHSLAVDDRLQATTLRPLTIGLTMTLGL
jgi:iron complex outermembrane recepter protein